MSIDLRRLGPGMSARKRQPAPTTNDTMSSDAFATLLEDTAAAAVINAQNIATVLREAAGVTRRLAQELDKAREK